MSKAGQMSGFNESNVGEAARSLFIDLLCRELHTAMPGYVVNVDSSGSARRVDVQPLLKATNIKGGQSTLAIIQGVLLMTPGTGKSSVIMPVAIGDLVLLVFSEKALEKWGLGAAPADGIFGRQFDLSDAFAIPMNFNTMSKTENANNADMIINHNGQTITIKNNGAIEIGSAALQAVMTESYKTALEFYLTAFQTIQTAIAALTPVTPFEIGFAVAITAFLSAFPSGFIAPANGLTSEVKAQ
jgi:hypothetical protein